jgi:hypothetical protein
VGRKTRSSHVADYWRRVPNLAPVNLVLVFRYGRTGNTATAKAANPSIILQRKRATNFLDEFANLMFMQHRCWKSILLDWFLIPSGKRLFQPLVILKLTIWGFFSGKNKAISTTLIMFLS